MGGSRGRMSGEAEAQLVSIKPKGKWPLLLAIPEQVLSTEEARRVLPAHYSRGDAVINISEFHDAARAFMQGRHELLGTALEDRLHQPIALHSVLCCLPAGVERQPRDSRAVLSGAGPSVGCFSRSSLFRPENQKSYCFLPCEQGMRAELLLTSIAPSGAHK